MKRFKLLTLILLVLSFVFTPLLTACSSGDQPVGEEPGGDITEAEKAGNVIYVATDGSDANGNGTKEKPYATIYAARDAIRAKKAESGLPDGGITVILEAGTYRITEPIEMTVEDSGEVGKPITYKAENGAEVAIDGGVKLDSSLFKPANDEFKARLQTEDAKANVVQIDLAEAGCYDLSEFYVPTWGGGVVYNNTQELYANSKNQFIAQWPNRGDEYAYSKLVAKKVNEEFPNGSNSYYELEIPEGKAELWQDADIITCGLFFNGWETCHYAQKWTETNLENGTLRVYAHTHIYEFKEDRPYYIFNIAEELDQPGEYFRDNETNILYYYPDGKLEELDIVFSQVENYLVHMMGTSYVAFDGIIFEHGRGSGITVGQSSYDESEEKLKSTDITVENCTFRALGGAALVMYDAFNAEVDSNEFYELGCAGIEISNPDYTVRNPSNNRITNNLIHDWALYYPTENPAITIRGMGFYVAHNEIYESTHTGILAEVGDSVFEYNIIHDISKMSGDAGAIYNGNHGWAEAGCVYRYNYIYNLRFDSDELYPNAIYLDDQLPCQYVYGNIIANVDGNGVSCNGRNSIIRNNIFYNISHYSIGIGESGLTFQVNDVKYPGGTYIWNSLINQNYTSELIAAMCPEYLITPEIGYVSHNIDEAGTPADVTAENNAAFGVEVGEIKDLDEITLTVYGQTLDGIVYGSGHSFINGAIRNNVVYTTEPGFTKIGKVEHALSDDSQVFCDIYSFEQIPYELIGITE